MLKMFNKGPDALGMLHFIGVGGIGMSGLAEYLHAAGFEVQGSDSAVNDNLRRLKKAGIRVFPGHHPLNIDKAFRVVVSSAIGVDNVELVEAKKRGIRVVHRSEILAEIAANQKSVIITGTHGKTTTTTMVFYVLGFGGLNPGVITGGIMRGIGSNMVYSPSTHFVAEADESDGSFTRFKPSIGIVTNVDMEHLDHYASEASIHDAFAQFLKNIDEDGVAILCYDHPQTRQFSKEHMAPRVITYGFHEDANIRAHNVRVAGESMVFDLSIFGVEYLDIILHAVGEHNVQNACAAIAAGYASDVEMDAIREGLLQFKGVKRRFEKLLERSGVMVVDDYAHHPVEIAATLKAARKAYPESRIMAVIQPHRYTRLKDLMQEFATCVTDADEVFLAPVYAAGENKIDGATHEALAIAMAGEFEGPVNMISSAQDLIIHVKDHAQRGDVILCMGAGSVSAWAHELAEAMGSWA